MALIILCLIYRYLHNVNIKCISTSGLHLSYIHCNHSFLIQKSLIRIWRTQIPKAQIVPNPQTWRRQMVIRCWGNPLQRRCCRWTVLGENSWNEKKCNTANVMRQAKFISLMCCLVSLWCTYYVHVKNNKKLEIIYCIAVFLCMESLQSSFKRPIFFFHFLTNRPHYESDISGHDFNIIPLHCFYYMYMHIVYVHVHL